MHVIHVCLYFDVCCCFSSPVLVVMHKLAARINRLNSLAKSCPTSDEMLIILNVVCVCICYCAIFSRILSHMYCTNPVILKCSHFPKRNKKENLTEHTHKIMASHSANARTGRACPVSLLRSARKYIAKCLYV